MAKEIKAPKPEALVDCPDCQGTGLADENHLCTTCAGSGKV